MQKYQREVACFYKEICNLLKLLQSKPTQDRQEATWLPALLVFLLSLSLWQVAACLCFLKNGAD